MANTVAVTESNFQAEVLDSKVPVLEEIARDQNGKLKVVKLDVDENPDISGRYMVHSIPTLMLFKGGQMVERITGALPKPLLLSRISPHLS